MSSTESEIKALLKIKNFGRLKLRKNRKAVENKVDETCLAFAVLHIPDEVQEPNIRFSDHVGHTDATILVPKPQCLFNKLESALNRQLLLERENNLEKSRVRLYSLNISLAYLASRPCRDLGYGLVEFTAHSPDLDTKVNTVMLSYVKYKTMNAYKKKQLLGQGKVHSFKGIDFV